MTKQELRKQIRITLKEKANQLPQLSKDICNKIITSEVYSNADTILAYMALGDEVDLELLLQDALKTGKKVFLPKVNPDSPEMKFYQITDCIQTSGGAFGILEPEEVNPFNAAEHNKTLVLVPGRGFTTAGARLGRGKAYYDTYFASLHKKVVLAGVCFSCQLLEELPVEAHDVFMDYVITEKGIINSGK